MTTEQRFRRRLLRAAQPFAPTTFLLALVVPLVAAPPATAGSTCSRAVIFTLPGITWSDIERVSPRHIVRAVHDGAAGSIAVRTVSFRSTYASGFATIGAGSRLDAPQTSGAPVAAVPGSDLFDRVRAGGLREIRTLAEEAGYDARPGALADALTGVPVAAVGNADLGRPPAAPFGRGRWALLAAMSSSGTVLEAATSSSLLERAPDAPWGVRTASRAVLRPVEKALADRCGVVVVDQGDLERAEQLALATGGELTARRDAALERADAVLGAIRRYLDPSRDLLLVLSPTSPAWTSQIHLGVAIAVGPGFRPGSTLESASTRRSGIVTLPDVAPTVLNHFDRSRPAVMTGRPWFATGPAHQDVIAAGVELDAQSVFNYRMQPRVSTGFVVFQVLVYLVITILLARAERARRLHVTRAWHWLEPAALAVVAFPVCTYIAGFFRGHELGPAGFIALLVVLDALLVGVVSRVVPDAFGRLLALTGFTTTVLFADLVSGSRLQFTTVFGSIPIFAGRFTGAGNITFAVLGASSLLSAALVVHRWPRSVIAKTVAALILVATIVIDGAPQWGSDVGGTLTLVPTFIVLWLLLSDRRPSVKAVVTAVVAAVVTLGIFVAVDVARPPESQTHLARLFEDVRDRGLGIFAETLGRKGRANVSVFKTSMWSLFLPPALGAMAWLLVRPRGRWQRLAQEHPKLRAGLIGGIVLAVVGAATNDSGIVISAVVLSFLVPLAYLVHVALELEAPT